MQLILHEIWIKSSRLHFEVRCKSSSYIVEQIIPLYFRGRVIPAVFRPQTKLRSPRETRPPQACSWPLSQRDMYLWYTFYVDHRTVFRLAGHVAFKAVEILSTCMNTQKHDKWIELKACRNLTIYLNIFIIGVQHNKKYLIYSVHN